jgi:hypothetical protein
MDISQRVQHALLGTSGVTDVTLTGSAVRIAGGDNEAGNFTLKALGSDQSRFELALSGGTRTELFSVSGNGGVQGSWSGTDGVIHAMAEHNSAVGMTWFAPSLAIGVRLYKPDVNVSYLGQGTKNGETVQHIRLVQLYPSLPETARQDMENLSAMEVYVDPVSALPTAIAYNVHPDNNMNADIPIEVDFSDYRLIQGAPIPFHIQKYMNGTLLLDLTVENAVINSGLTNSAFEAN